MTTERSVVFVETNGINARFLAKGEGGGAGICYRAI